MPIFCQKCGARNNDNALVCRVCGTTFSGSKGEQKEESKAVQYLFAAVVIALFVVIVVAPLPAARSFFASIEANLGISSNSVHTQSNSTTLASSSTTSLNTSQPTTSVVTTNTVAKMDQITAVNIYMNYRNNATNSSANTIKTYGGFNVTSGESFPYTIALSDTSYNSIVIQSIVLTTQGFNITQVTPALPEILNPGSNISVTSLIKGMENASYVGTLSIAVYESAYMPSNTVGQSNTINSTSNTMG